ncbi:putative DNA helicase INO80 [Neolecta irregularis DAH-3]|uniref:Chromatin-remodeling ATPase INO80 n=1 Tax=Neolecta irregularis (strain DAH-3) TaxID=1198029 RepID=A0A1U7LWD4_NEOID|nr:putative DNA helicase INO80 [Neolecta irregularis DAH-3]|eukprot:OLL26990.1 putative DNA helicase INO80 [Neolecta irregularis DAH-3]
MILSEDTAILQTRTGMATTNTTSLRIKTTWHGLQCGKETLPGQSSHPAYPFPAEPAIAPELQFDATSFPLYPDFRTDNTNIHPDFLEQNSIHPDLRPDLPDLASRQTANVFEQHVGSSVFDSFQAASRSGAMAISSLLTGNDDKQATPSTNEKSNRRKSSKYTSAEDSKKPRGGNRKKKKKGDSDEEMIDQSSTSKKGKHSLAPQVEPEPIIESESDVSDDEQWINYKMIYMNARKRRFEEIQYHEEERVKNRRTEIHKKLTSRYKKRADRAEQKTKPMFLHQATLKVDAEEERLKAKKRRRTEEKREIQRRQREEAAIHQQNHYRLVDEQRKVPTSAQQQSQDPDYIQKSLPILKIRKPGGRSQKTLEEIQDKLWKDMVKKEMPKAYRLMQTSMLNKQSNHKKTCQLAAKEARRWQVRTNKNLKDTQAKAKRAMREMLVFWKRNEREERDLRKRAEKEALDKAKKEEELREARRQARKLNFLITQTELYSHFVGKKIGTAEAEMTGDTATDSHFLSEKLKLVIDDDVPMLDAEREEKIMEFEEDDEEGMRAVAARKAQDALNAARSRAQEFDGKKDVNLGNINLDDGEMNFQNPTGFGGIEIAQPKMLHCQLKEYQLKGLNWLANLYEQGINGILADEMGLGKTVQSISVMAYLAESHQIWGPFLVIAPASTLHNWQQEITRFVPQFKVLPYWGNGKDRKVLRKFWNRKQLTYTEDAEFHVLVTSYQLAVSDEKYFNRVKWQYMILDEAQAIKSSSSSRWKTLLNFQCRNRLLLTGTPIQNTMQELWALLHFIMPSLFDSHDEFSEWFSKDIESHAQSNTQLNQQQLKRLHMILKPFMLRRVKKHVQSELGEKIELDSFCNLSIRQRIIYKSLRDKISLTDILEKAAAGGDDGIDSLMNIVMQFRKVCNHPDLFERADVKSPLYLVDWGITPNMSRETNLYVPYSATSKVTFSLPKYLYRNGGVLHIPSQTSNLSQRERILGHLMNIWSPDWIEESLRLQNDSAFSFSRFIDTSASEASHVFNNSIFKRAMELTEPLKLRYRVIYDEKDDRFYSPSSMLIIEKSIQRSPLKDTTNERVLHSLCRVAEDTFALQNFSHMEPIYDERVRATPVQLVCPDRGCVYEQENLLFDPEIRKNLFGITEDIERTMLERNVPIDSLAALRGFLPRLSMELQSWQPIKVPSMRKFIADSGKLAHLDRLLHELKSGGHRVLLYFQMTRMIDLMEEYLAYRHWKYLRLDGSSKIADRRDMVNEWQTRPELFIFLLSTRAGGLGINLTAADTVIFYDSDWNPTNDSQATDRAHRIGQTRQVTVYRLLTRGTIEERILKRAKQKEEVQKVVISGGDKGGVDFSKGPREVVSWLLDDDALEQQVREQQAKRLAQEEASNKRKGKRKAADDPPKARKTLEDMYHEGEGNFEDNSSRPSGAVTPVSISGTATPRAGFPKKLTTGIGSRGGRKPAHKKMSREEALRRADGDGEGSSIWEEDLQA